LGHCTYSFTVKQINVTCGDLDRDVIKTECFGFHHWFFFVCKISKRFQCVGIQGERENNASEIKKMISSNLILLWDFDQH
jgi:hypothetical protein